MEIDGSSYASVFGTPGPELFRARNDSGLDRYHWCNTMAPQSFAIQIGEMTRDQINNIDIISAPQFIFSSMDGSSKLINQQSE